MRRVRVIPSLLIKEGGLVKSVKFGKYTYVGDPINAVKIFNDKEVDELILLDISATVEHRKPDVSFIRQIASEAFMPVGYGGGVTTADEVQQLVNSGVEKVILNTIAFDNPAIVTEGARRVGSQSVVVSVDVKKNFWGKHMVFTRNGTFNTKQGPATYAQQMESAGAGELILTSIDRDGTFTGYDNELVHQVSSKVAIPVVANGGASTVSDFYGAITKGASAVAAGSMFVFQGPHRAVLISYPTQQVLKNELFNLIRSWFLLKTTLSFNGVLLL